MKIDENKADVQSLLIDIHTVFLHPIVFFNIK